MGQAGRAAAAVLAAILLAACSPRAWLNHPPPDPPGVHVVRRGETLYAIAWRHGLDYRRLAAWNGIAPPYRIHPGQRIRLRPPQAATARAGAPKATASPGRRPPAPRAQPTPEAERPAVPAAREAPPAAAGPAGRPVFSWPTEGPLLAGFRDGAKRGIDIGGRPGQPVRAAAAGRVVYAGSGLVGYGRLIIVKHNAEWLSAYGHNRRLLVREGEHVRAGQVIAELGASGADRPKLHFEIRRFGEPVDPLTLLPRR
ncbi:lipoprotein NlpD [Inmirania thermothiophila]|uniref:Lipoprotein NlpD n=2 Tax=Inmirania thermothiophila TaxID=1750597 RepID=A0A3N1Y0A3_9GAMM|nr:lipoprotein NlpD [Inmirania thermothiophila]